MVRRFLMCTAVCLMLASPLFASADAISDIKARIEEHLKAARELQTQLFELQGGASSTQEARGEIKKPEQGVMRACHMITRNLTRNAQGEDVASLQEFLKEKGFFNNATSTFFGVITETAVQKWQASEGLATAGTALGNGFGSVGPKSREALMRRCKNLKTEHTIGTTTRPIPPTTSNSAIPKREGDDKPKVCPMNFAPVCGSKNGRTHTFSNKCFLEAESATFVSVGSCVGSTTPVTNTVTLPL